LFVIASFAGKVPAVAGAMKAAGLAAAALLATATSCNADKGMTTGVRPDLKGVTFLEANGATTGICA
jgi:hypothetical protein